MSILIGLVISVGVMVGFYCLAEDDSKITSVLRTTAGTAWVIVRFVLFGLLLVLVTTAEYAFVAAGLFVVGLVGSTYEYTTGKKCDSMYESYCDLIDEMAEVRRMTWVYVVKGGSVEA